MGLGKNRGDVSNLCVCPFFQRQESSSTEASPARNQGRGSAACQLSHRARRELIVLFNSQPIFCPSPPASSRLWSAVQVHTLSLSDTSRSPHPDNTLPKYCQPPSTRAPHLTQQQVIFIQTEWNQASPHPSPFQ